MELNNLVMFDLDGTLIDTMPQYAKFIGESLFSIKKIPKEKITKDYFSLSGLPFDIQLNWFDKHYSLGLNENQKNEIIDVFKLAKNRIIQNTLPIEGIPDIWNYLSMKICIYGISSNTETDVLKKFLYKNPYKIHFALGYDSSEGLQKGKTHVLRIQKDLGMQFSKILFVADSNNDYIKAIENNWNFCAFGPSSDWAKTCDDVLHCDSVDELLEYFDNWFENVPSA